MRRTVRVKLVVDESDVALLEHTVEEFLFAANFVVEHASRGKEVTTDRLNLHHQTYEAVRKRTELNSGLVQNARNRAAEALASRETRLSNGQCVGTPRFTSPTVWHDKRTASFFEDHATLATTAERVSVDYRLPNDLRGTPHEEYLLNEEFEITTADLLRRDGDWYLHISLKSTEDTPQSNRSATEHQTVLGVDSGVTNIAVTSSGAFWSGRELQHWQREYEKRRGVLHQLDTRDAHRIIRSVGRKERGRFTEMLHRISNELIAEAERCGCAVIVFEDLTGIRRREGASWGHLWAFNRLYQYVMYKSFPRDIDVARTNPTNSSVRCSTCGFIDRENRDGESFTCLDCGYQNHADYNAAKNIGLRYLRSDQNGSDGGAPLGVRLNSGTLHANGEISSLQDDVEHESPR